MNERKPGVPEFKAVNSSHGENNSRNELKLHRERKEKKKETKQTNKNHQMEKRSKHSQKRYNNNDSITFNTFRNM